jgi:hypothetical protein
MGREPGLTFEGALRILGQHEEPKWIKRLDAALGGAFLVGGVVGTVAAGPAALPALGMFAAVWGWLEPKDQAIELLKQAVGKLSGRVAGTRGRERRELIAAAHTTIVVAAFFEALREQVGPEFFGRLEMTEKEKVALIARAGVAKGAPVQGALDVHQSTFPWSLDLHESAYEALYTADVPAPSATRGFEENVAGVLDYLQSLAVSVDDFVGTLSISRAVATDWDAVATAALERYRSHFLMLAATVPEFMIWALLNEGAATRSAVAVLGADQAVLADV